MKPSALLKRGHPTLWNMNLKIFFYFCGSFLPFWIRIRIPNPDPLTRLNPDPVRIRIRNPAVSWSADWPRGRRGGLGVRPPPWQRPGSAGPPPRRIRHRWWRRWGSGPAGARCSPAAPGWAAPATKSLPSDCLTLITEWPRIKMTLCLKAKCP